MRFASINIAPCDAVKCRALPMVWDAMQVRQALHAALGEHAAAPQVETPRRGRLAKLP